ncbi:hypothetical protein HanRHA438_Chr09g0404681 [Helianthus annuus]|nr:hypothetical protein HanRHA438_Chr09g0404681 [Helianthus annuus]
MASTQISFTVRRPRRIFKLSDLLLHPLKCILKTTFSFRHPLRSFGRLLAGNCTPYRHNTMLRRTDSFADERFIGGGEHRGDDAARSCEEERSLIAHIPS